MPAAILGSLVRDRLPMMRWSFLRLFTPLARDGREMDVLNHVVATAEPGNIDDVIRVIDDFGRRRRYLVNVGDTKGLILDAAVERARPSQLLELGTYIGYSALRIARVMPAGSRLVSLECVPAHAVIARAIIAHAGASDRITIIDGKISDPAIRKRLADEHGFAEGELGFLFLDHHKDAYVSDLECVVSAGWLRPGSVVVADNVKFPGAPEYQAYMAAREGSTWQTATHRTHAEYQTLFTDIVLESDFLAAGD